MKLNLSDLQVKFIKRNLSLVLAPILFLGLALLILPSVFHTDDSELTIELKGHLSSLQLVRAKTEAENYFYFSVKEYPQTFKLAKLSEADQELLATEQFNNEVRFSIEKSRLDQQASTISVVAFSTVKNVYLRGDDAAILFQKSRYMAAFFEIILISSLIWCLILAVTKYKKAATAEVAEEFDPIVIIIAQNPRKTVGFLALVVIIIVHKLLPSIICVLGFGYFLYWFKKHESEISWIKNAIESGQRLRVQRTATIAPKHVKAIQLLIKSGRDLNIQDKNGRTPLHIAATKGHVEAVELLLRNGVKLNLQDKAGLTPVMIAAQKGFMGVVVKLLEKGADLLVINPDGANALALAQKNKKNRGMIEYLLKETAKAEAAKKAKEEAEALAAAEGSVTAVVADVPTLVTDPVNSSEPKKSSD